MQTINKTLNPYTPGKVEPPSRGGKRHTSAARPGVTASTGQLIGGGLDSADGNSKALAALRAKEKARAEELAARPVPRARQSHIALGSGGLEGRAGEVQDMRARGRETKNRNAGMITRLEYDEGPSRSMRSADGPKRPDPRRAKPGQVSSQMQDALSAVDEPKVSGPVASRSEGRGQTKMAANNREGHRWENMAPVSKRDEADASGASMKGRFGVPRPKDTFHIGDDGTSHLPRQSRSTAPKGQLNMQWTGDTPRSAKPVDGPDRRKRPAAVDHATRKANPITGENHTNIVEKVGVDMRARPRDSPGLLQTEDPSARVRYAPPAPRATTRDSTRETGRDSQRPSSRFSGRPKDTMSIA
jgi:hypothetical protein